jgi:hypothetical protein
VRSSLPCWFFILVGLLIAGFLVAPLMLRLWSAPLICPYLQNRAVAYCRQPASTVTLGIDPRWDPWPYTVFVQCQDFCLFFFFRCSSVDKKGRVGLFYNWCSLTTPTTTSVKVKATLRLTVSQSVNLGVEPHLGLMTRCLAITIWQLRCSFVGRPLWREDGSVFCMCCWVFPMQSFSGPSPLGLATIFYCLRFETSLFVASYDSQGHGGGIRPRLHTGLLHLKCSPPWNRMLAPRTEDTLPKGNFSSVVQVVTGITSVNNRCSDNNCLSSRCLRIATIRLSNITCILEPLRRKRPYPSQYFSPCRDLNPGCPAHRPLLYRLRYVLNIFVVCVGLLFFCQCKDWLLLTS